MHYFRNLLKFVPANNRSPKVCTFVYPNINGLGGGEGGWDD